MTERLTILKRIEFKIDGKSSKLSINHRSELEKLNQFAENATEFYVVAVYAGILFASYLSFFEKKIKNGLKVHALILDPEGLALNICNQITIYPDNKEVVFCIAILTQNY